MLKKHTSSSERKELKAKFPAIMAMSVLAVISVTIFHLLLHRYMFPKKRRGAEVGGRWA